MNFFQYDEHTPTEILKIFRYVTLVEIDELDPYTQGIYRDPNCRFARDLYDLQLKEIDDLLESRGFSL